ncbi:nitrite reductase (NADH) small subunit [Amycolatopsis xylanica]|uniref:Nitrite reductase (NADH) small subunit n=1 Tax=Amycolatopsis xylanica TaxID=589385 RepID=A0A1H3SM26_9PSEU|nr:nitrite reductase small subunit NirD [Amycolatopsis xylanica]SDZ38611.1 nitrite reductase (NADH) small subunit [Amycolatopsis xylanica]
MTASAERSWVAVCPVGEVPTGAGVAALLADGAQVAIFRTGKEFFGLSNVDPFSGAAVLSRGIVGDSSGVPVVASPIYKQRFDLVTGRCLDEDGVSVRTYPVRVVNGVVHVGSP